ncbi:hypothetical protein [Bradyrhizobium sp. SZCCHNRI20481]|uniref:hypothetical protein n=1 Tax=Bradyrhizobium sp. SZCCHNRI20481 TaxID=3057286 RepID=UPI0029162ADF|nr:hypothetical protein [Bradyrhizobium sp. SZCCHNRI20481]
MTNLGEQNHDAMISAESSAWTPAFVFPDLFLKDPIEDEIAAIVTFNDTRVREICARMPEFAEFVSKFTDAFGRKLQPSILILNKDAPKSFIKLGPATSFRDLVALSAIPISRAKSALWQQSFGTYYSDWYDFYPWMITLGRHLGCSTPAVANLETVDNFRGQGDPGLLPVTLDKTDFDLVLLNALLKRWRVRYNGRPPTWPDRALFRSLDMAFAAAKMPAKADVSHFSLGRSISLWVSAFEILAHPKTGRSETSLVYSLLDKAPWHDAGLRRKRYKAFVSANKQKQRKAPLRSLPCWLYGEIYHARNDFLHGNPVRPDRLVVKTSGKSLFNYAPLLYRMALASFLDIRIPSPLASIQQLGADHLARRMAFFDQQREIERELRAIRKAVNK